MSNILTSNVLNARVVSVTFDPAGCAVNTTNEQTVTVSGVKVGDLVFVNKPSSTTGVGVVGARVSAADTVAINFGNFTAATVNPASEAYVLMIVRPDGSAGTDANM